MGANPDGLGKYIGVGWDPNIKKVIRMKEDIKRLKYNLGQKEKENRELRRELELSDNASFEMNNILSAFSRYFCEKFGGEIKISRKELNSMIGNGEYEFFADNDFFYIRKKEVKEDAREQDQNRTV